jgi:hypothetical protein
MFTLKEFQDNAQKRLTALQENDLAVKAGKPEPHKVVGNAGLKETKAYSQFLQALGGDPTGVPNMKQNLKEMITSTDIIDQIPKVITGQMIEAAEPQYLAANFFTKVQAPAGGVAVIVPIIGEIFAKEMGEHEPYQESTPDTATLENAGVTIDIKKIGLKVSITEEAMTDYTWDIYNITLRKIAGAFVRFKEEKCMNEFSKHGHIVFDNALRGQNPAAGTTGLGEDGLPNNTLSIEDFLDLMLAAITNHRNPTDCIMHPLTWVVFARNAMIGAGMTWGALGGADVHPAGGTQGSPNAGMQNNMGPQKFILRPEQVQNRLPFALTMNVSPFVNFDKEKKLFDMYVIDRSNVGVIAQREEITMDNWNNPELDVQFVKARERYGVGISDHGLGIMVARNIAVAPSYPKTVPVLVRSVE